ncbi:MAG: rRNA (adenine2503-C2)-methyltransferase [Phycisphaerales bacterium]|jgi:23S rRNA (adenine2503-C2)-methyltransferase|nr:rRNA (adenine2503-C2)-methyltransferase [Phycisphaerales bacterium]
MPLDLLTSQKLHFLGLRAEEFDAQVQQWGWPTFRAQQVRDWVYSKLVDQPAEMSNLGKLDRQALAERADVTTSRIVSQQISNDGTIKLLLAWPDGAQAETVMIPDGERRTACVSSQVGCPVGCKFCASGVNGVKGNLSAGQIVEQVYRLNQILANPKPLDRARDRAGLYESGADAVRNPSDDRAPHISNVVFMGMGEPLSNYANVMQAIRILNDPKCFNMGARRITISTVGVPSKMRQLAEEELPINLALSLHAPNEPLRRELIPWAEHFALNDILEACRVYFDRTGREITLEYILLSGVNDRPEHARELAKLCKTMRANVNLIRYNEVTGLPYKRPVSRDVIAFQEILRSAGVNAHVRKSRGRDIDAACGQLRRKEQERADASAPATTTSSASTSTSLPLI